VLTNETLKTLLLCKNADFSYGSVEYGQGYYISHMLDPNEKLSDVIKNKKSNSFVLSAIHTQQFQIGALYEPIKLVVKYFDYVQSELVEKIFVFHKNTSVEYVKELLMQKNIITDPTNTTLTLALNGKTPNHTYNLTTNESSRKKLSDFEFIKNFDYLLIETSQMGANYNLNRKAEKLVDIQVIDCINNFKTTTICFNTNDEIKNLKILAISALALDNINFDNCHLRYLNKENQAMNSISNEFKQSNGSNYVGLRLYDHDTVSQIVDETSNIFTLCPGRAPNSNEITVKCCMVLNETHESTGYLLNEVKCEVLIDCNEKISSLVSNLVSLLELPTISEGCQEKYYLKTINWMGDVDQILNNLNRTVFDVKLKNNDHVCLTKGSGSSGLVESLFSTFFFFKAY
jgi:hypothetical protein